MADNDSVLYILSFSFFLVFLAFSTTQNLESSLNSGSLGTFSLGVVYITLTLSSFVAPKFLERFGVKKCLTVSLATYALFVLSNLQATWFTLVPAAALLGIGAAVLWSAQGVYISLIGSDPKLASRASGIFWGIYQSSQVVGNSIAFAILRSGSESGTVPHSTARLLFGLFTLSACTGVALSTFLKDADEIIRAESTSYEEIDREDLEPMQESGGTAVEGSDSPLIENSAGDGRLTMATILFKDRNLLMLLPLFLYSGMEQAFVFSEFTGFVVKPVLGEANVPLIMVLFGGCNAILSWLLGSVGSKSPSYSKIMLSIAGLLHICILLAIAFLLDLDALSGSKGWALMLVFATLFGFTDASLNTNITTMLASIYASGDYRTKLAFSHFKMWQSSATAAAFFYSAHVSLTFKCVLTVASGVLGLTGLWITSQKPSSTSNAE